MIKQLIIIYWRIVLFQETPENTPYSPILMGLSAIVLALLFMAQWSFSQFDHANDLCITIGSAISLILSFIIYTYAILFLRGLSARWIQTTTCLFCTHILMRVIASPLFLIEPYLSSHTHLKNPLLLFIGVIYLFISLGLSVWQFVVTVHIYKYALNTTSIQSVLAAFGLIAVNLLTVSFWR